MDTPHFIDRSVALAVRRSIRHALPCGIRPSAARLTEAVAAAFGFKSHAALLAAADKGPVRAPFNGDVFQRRLAALGCTLSDSNTALATGAAWAGISNARMGQRDAFAKALWEARLVAGFAWPVLRDLAFTIAVTPDASVPTFALTESGLLYHPAHVLHLKQVEMEAALTMACVHVHLGHPARREERDQVLWDMACEMVVAAALSRHVNLPCFVAYDGGAFPATMPAEDAYFILAETPKRTTAWIEMRSGGSPLAQTASDLVVRRKAPVAPSSDDRLADIVATVLDGQEPSVPPSIPDAEAVTMNHAACARLKLDRDGGCGKAELLERADRYLAFVARHFGDLPAVAAGRMLFSDCRLPVDGRLPGFGLYAGRIKSTMDAV